MPVVLLCLGIPRPVGFLCVGKDDAGALVLRVCIAPDVVITLGRPLRRAPGFLKPRVLIRRVVNDQLDHDLHVALMRCGQELLEIRQRSIAWIHIQVVRDIIAIVPQRRREER